MELLKVEYYNKGLKLDIEEDFFEISAENAKNVTKLLNCDEVFDALIEMPINHTHIKERVLADYPEQFENLLHEFFIKKRNSNKYLTIEQQEEMEDNFHNFINQYNR